MMKRLSDFKDAKAIEVVADLIPYVMEVATNKANAELAKETDPFKMFSGFFKNSPEALKNIFAVLSEENPETYHCDGMDVAQNIITLASDPRFIKLFTSQEQTGDATSSTPASGTTEAP